MKTLTRTAVTNVQKALSALESAGIDVVTIRGRGGSIVAGTHLADSIEVVLGDSADIASAQAILNAFDPATAQSEIAAEEQAERDLQAWLKTARTAFLTLKGRYDKLETWAKTKGYTP